MSEEVLTMHGSKKLTPWQKRIYAFLTLCNDEGLSRDAAFKLYAFARNIFMEADNDEGEND